jgi:hypothetical protein
MKPKVYQPSNHSHSRRQQQMQRFLAQPQFFADLQRALPVTPQQHTRRLRQLLQMFQDRLHSIHPTNPRPFDQPLFFRAAASRRHAVRATALFTRSTLDPEIFFIFFLPNSLAYACLSLHTLAGLSNSLAVSTAR